MHRCKPISCGALRCVKNLDGLHLKQLSGNGARRTEGTMMRNNLCSKCGSNEIVPNVEVRDYDASSYRELTVSVQLPRPPGAFIYQGYETSSLRAWVCGQC